MKDEIVKYERKEPGSSSPPNIWKRLTSFFRHLLGTDIVQTTEINCLPNKEEKEDDTSQCRVLDCDVINIEEVEEQEDVINRENNKDDFQNLNDENFII